MSVKSQRLFLPAGKKIGNSQAGLLKLKTLSLLTWLCMQRDLRFYYRIKRLFWAKKGDPLHNSGQSQFLKKKPGNAKIFPDYEKTIYNEFQTRNK